MKKSDLENINIIYYICLLSSFQYFNKITKLNIYDDLILLRASISSYEEIQDYKAKTDGNFIRIYKEFLSTTMDNEKAQNFFDKNDPYIPEFLWEIRIPKDIKRNEPINFIDISNISQFNEKEILIRSGAIIEIQQILDYTEKITDEIITFKNKFKKICTLKRFSIAPFFRLIYLDPSIERLWLNDNLGLNEKNMVYLREALIKSNTIKELNFLNNKLDSNEKNMVILKKALEKNKSIQILYLYKNKLGSNEKNMLNLKEALEIKNSIKELNLGWNDLGSNEKNMLYLKEALKKTIQFNYCILLKMT